MDLTSGRRHREYEKTAWKRVGEGDEEEEEADTRSELWQGQGIAPYESHPIKDHDLQLYKTEKNVSREDFNPDIPYGCWNSESNGSDERKMAEEVEYLLVSSEGNACKMKATTIFEDADHFARHYSYKLMPISFEAVNETIIQIEHNYCHWAEDPEAKTDGNALYNGDSEDMTCNGRALSEDRFLNNSGYEDESKESSKQVSSEECTVGDEDHSISSQPLDLSLPFLPKESKTDNVVVESCEKEAESCAEESQLNDSNKENVTSSSSSSTSSSSSSSSSSRKIEVTISRPGEKEYYEPCEIFINDVARISPDLVRNDCYEIDIIDRTHPPNLQKDKYRTYYIVSESTWRLFNNSDERIVLTNDLSPGESVNSGERLTKPRYLIFDRYSLMHALARMCERRGGNFEYTCLEETKELISKLQNNRRELQSKDCDSGEGEGQGREWSSTVVEGEGAAEKESWNSASPESEKCPHLVETDLLQRLLMKEGIGYSHEVDLEGKDESLAEPVSAYFEPDSSGANEGVNTSVMAVEASPISALMEEEIEAEEMQEDVEEEEVEGDLLEMTMEEEGQIGLVTEDVEERVNYEQEQIQEQKEVEEEEQKQEDKVKKWQQLQDKEKEEEEEVGLERQEIEEEEEMQKDKEEEEEDMEKDKEEEEVKVQKDKEEEEMQKDKKEEEDLEKDKEEEEDMEKDKEEEEDMEKDKEEEEMQKDEEEVEVQKDKEEEEMQKDEEGVEVQKDKEEEVMQEDEEEVEVQKDKEEEVMQEDKKEEEEEEEVQQEKKDIEEEQKEEEEVEEEKQTEKEVGGEETQERMDIQEEADEKPMEEERKEEVGQDTKIGEDRETEYGEQNLEKEEDGVNKEELGQDEESKMEEVAPERKEEEPKMEEVAPERKEEEEWEEAKEVPEKDGLEECTFELQEETVTTKLEESSAGAESMEGEVVVDDACQDLVQEAADEVSEVSEDVLEPKNAQSAVRESEIPNETACAIENSGITDELAVSEEKVDGSGMNPMPEALTVTGEVSANSEKSEDVEEQGVPEDVPVIGKGRDGKEVRGGVKPRRRSRTGSGVNSSKSGSPAREDGTRKRRKSSRSSSMDEESRKRAAAKRPRRGKRSQPAMILRRRTRSQTCSDAEEISMVRPRKLRREAANGEKVRGKRQERKPRKKDGKMNSPPLRKETRSMARKRSEEERISAAAKQGREDRRQRRAETGQKKTEMVDGGKSGRRRAGRKSVKRTKKEEAEAAVEVKGKGRGRRKSTKVVKKKEETEMQRQRRVSKARAARLKARRSAREATLAKRKNGRRP